MQLLQRPAACLRACLGCTSPTLSVCMATTAAAMLFNRHKHSPALLDSLLLLLLQIICHSLSSCAERSFWGEACAAARQTLSEHCSYSF